MTTPNATPPFRDQSIRYRLTTAAAPIPYTLTDAALTTTRAESPQNWVPTRSGKVRAVCQWCDHRSRPVEPSDDGRPGFWDLRGWSESPFPVSFEHRDGTHGSLYTCPACLRLRAERQAAGIRPLLSPSPARAVAVAGI